MNKGGKSRSLSSTGGTALDLRSELDASLRGGFQFDGVCYSARELSTAPNPCLNIEGIGQIGLPLSERDAKSITQLLKKPSPGRGKRAAPKKNPPRVWEIQADRVSFENENWKEFVKITVAKAVWSGLVGAKPGLPKCQLDRLLLHEPNSEPMSLSDTGKPDNTFATAIIVLPSSHEGGQVHVTYATQTYIMDMSAKSSVTPTLLTWYTEVANDVQPITSGYRLALVYNVIHDCAPETIPRLPKMDDPVAKFRAALTKWANKDFGDDERKLNLFAYVLEHRYTSFALHNRGAKLLKGQDSHLIAHTRAVAEELGFMVLLGALDYQPQGCSDDEDSDDYLGFNKRRRYGYTCAGYNTTDGIELQLEELVDLEGNEIIGSHKLEIGMGNLLPKNNALAKTDGSAPYGVRTSSLLDRQLAMVLIHQSNADEVFFPAGGLSYALAKLQQASSDSQSDSEKKLSKMVLDGLTPKNAEMAKSLLGHALRWGAIDLWKEIVLKEGYTIATLGSPTLVSALERFAFQDLRTCFELLIQRKQPLKDRLEFVDAVRAQSNGQPVDVVNWCNEWSLQALGTFSEPKTEDIPLLVDVARIRGISFIAKEVLPQLVKESNSLDFTNLDFIIKFIITLDGNRDSIPSMSTSQPQTLPWTTFVDECLTIAVNQCPKLKAQDRLISYAFDRVTAMHVNKYVDVFEAGIITGRLGPCSKLCQEVLAAEGETSRKFSLIHVPFVSKLGEVCRKHNFNILAFHGLLHRIISSYLEKILGPSSKQYLSRIRKIGCGGCQHCRDLDEFALEAKATILSFKEDATVRDHLERRLLVAADLFRFQTLQQGRPYTLQVTKRSEVVSAQQWTTRLAAAESFLASIGDDAVIAKIMGARYQEVQNALKGVRQFVENPNAPSASAVATAAQKPAKGVAVQPRPQVQATAMKRKRA